MKRVFFLLLPVFLASLACAEEGRPEVRTLRDEQGRWRLERNGVPYELRGAGGSGQLDLLKSIGGNTIRTWGIDQLKKRPDGGSLLDDAWSRGISIMAGIWVDHERHGFSYDDPEWVASQREKVRQAVRTYRDHPAILIWGLGNEMEGPMSDGRDPRIWRELEVLAKIVKEEDPGRPVCTVIAGAPAGKIEAIIKDYPSLDILGVNAYAGAAGVGKAVAAAGWKKPFILAEYGPVGHWEVRHTAWGAPIEPSSKDKASNYYASHRGSLEDSKGLCVGTFAFVWGHKQETTATWYGMFLSTGEKLPSVDAVAYAWSGKWPANRSPRIDRLKADFIEATVAPGTELHASVEMRDADGDELAVEWSVRGESTERKVGGDTEAAPPEYPECVVSTDGPSVTLRAPEKPGAYRLFVFVRDGKGGASADNFPFLVKASAPAGPVMPSTPVDTAEPVMPRAEAAAP